jgi:molybdopterin-guanine dinucleotide biosynthesis protein A
MNTGTAVCEEFQQLLQELRWVLQLCAEYESPFVLPIDAPKLTPELADQLYDQAFEEKARVESRIFIHQCTCLRCCLRSP